MPKQSGRSRRRPAARRPATAALIGDLRERLGFSQERLAAAIGVSLPTVSRWQKGKTKPDALGLRALERYVESLGPDYADVLARLRGAASGSTGPGEPDGPVTGSRRNLELDTKAMEGLLWRAACAIRGEKDAPKFKDYILPLIFIKRLSDVFDDEVADLAAQFESADRARQALEVDHDLVRFYIPGHARWPVIRGEVTNGVEWPDGRAPRTLGERLTTAARSIARANPTLQGVIDIVDFNETRSGEREISEAALKRLIEMLSEPRYRLGLQNVEPDFLGRAYEYLLRKFAEGQGQSAGEFYTPREVGVLMARLVEPRPGESVYDPCCGSAGLLIKCQLRLKERDGSADVPLGLFGQERIGSSFAIARMNMVLHDMAGEIVRGDTMLNPKFVEKSRLRRFDVVVTNPMWNQDNFAPAIYEADPFERFAGRGGFAPGSSADWAWLQHVAASLADAGRAAVVIDTGAASRGSGNAGENREKAIRRWFVERDLVEGVILLPENLFYNTPAAGLIIVLNQRKSAERRGRVLLLNAGAEFEKGRPKNFIPDRAITRIAEAYHGWRDVPRLANVLTNAEIAEKDFNLSPSRYVDTAVSTEHRDIQEILDDLARLDAETKASDAELKPIFEGLGYRWRQDG